MDVLENLKPSQKMRVIELVKEAGIDVRDWARFKGGAARAAVNPKYCYEWSFVEPGKVVVLNCWYDDIRPRGATVAINLAMRNWAMRNVATGRKAVWAKRALKFDEALKTALRDELPIRVIVCAGQKRRGGDPSARASSVERRKLDPVPWAITSYDYKTGRGVLTRGARPKTTAKAGVPSNEIRNVLLELSRLVSGILRRI